MGNVIIDVLPLKNEVSKIDGKNFNGRKWKNLDLYANNKQTY